MSEVKVPDWMLAAALTVIEDPYMVEDVRLALKEVILAWADHPIIPTTEQISWMSKQLNGGLGFRSTMDDIKNAPVLFQKIMFTDVLPPIVEG